MYIMYMYPYTPCTLLDVYSGFIPLVRLLKFRIYRIPVEKARNLSWNNILYFVFHIFNPDLQKYAYTSALILAAI